MQSAPAVPFNVSLLGVPIITFKPLALQNAIGSVIVLCARERCASIVIPNTEANNTAPTFNRIDFMIGYLLAPSLRRAPRNNSRQLRGKFVALQIADQPVRG